MRGQIVEVVECLGVPSTAEIRRHHPLDSRHHLGVQQRVEPADRRRRRASSIGVRRGARHLSCPMTARATHLGRRIVWSDLRRGPLPAPCRRRSASPQDTRVLTFVSTRCHRMRICVSLGANKRVIWRELPRVTARDFTLRTAAGKQFGDIGQFRTLQLARIGAPGTDEGEDAVQTAFRPSLTREQQRRDACQHSSTVSIRTVADHEGIRGLEYQGIQGQARRYGDRAFGCRARMRG